MACLAQIVNVLQAVILTEGEKMLKTPTYHVMHMFRHHQGAELIESSLSGAGVIGVGEWNVPELTESVSEKDGTITITVNNLSMTDDKDLDILFVENKELVEARIVNGADPHDHNTFEEPEIVKETDFTGVKALGNKISLTLPKASVALIRVKYTS